MTCLNYWTNPHNIFIMETSNEDTLHTKQVFDLTYFSRFQRSNFNNFYDVLQHLNCWADLLQIFIMDTKFVS
jgi:hypothetical protein